MARWLLNIGMIGSWTKLFFRTRELGASALASGAMIGTDAGYVAAAAEIDRPAAVVNLALVTWLGFVTLFAEEVCRRNPDRDASDS